MKVAKGPLPYGHHTTPTNTVQQHQEVAKITDGTDVLGGKSIHRASYCTRSCRRKRFLRRVFILFNF